MNGRSPIERLIDAAVRCTKCGQQGPPGSCACWERCSCGWFAAAGRPCRNPATEWCSTKVKYGDKKGRQRWR